MKWLIVFSMVALVLLAPQLVDAQSNSANWCYTFDLRETNPFTLNTGYWFDGAGYSSLHSGSDYLIDVSYSHSTIVLPTQVRIRIRNGDAYETRSTDMLGNVFGVTVAISNEDIMGGSARDFVFPAAENAVGTTLDLELDSNWYMYLQSVTVYGVTSNPFPSTNCAPESAVEIPAGAVIEALATAQAMASGVNPNELGVPSEDGAQLFGYVKWALSPTAAAEVAGPFEGFFSHIGTALYIAMILVGMYAIVYLATHMIRFAIWLFMKIMYVINAISNAIGGVLGFILKFVGL